jgi:16S rRNA (guanine527-N7)-methyltransferase
VSSVSGPADLPTLEAGLAAGARALGLAPSDAQATRLVDFAALLMRWNRTHNLTAIRDERDVLTHHLLDCMAVAGPVRRELSRIGGLPRVLDVGSGGGLPGVVLAILMPDVQVHCVDAVGKKAGFVRQAALELGLANLQASHGRVEALAEQDAAIVTSRAFASLADFVRLTARHLRVGGAWMAMKGKQPVEEMKAVEGLAKVFHVEHLDVPGLGAERCLVWMRPR